MEQNWIARVEQYLEAEGSLPLGKLDRFRHWLSEEAIPAGGMARGEEERLYTRHLADSLLFSKFIPASSPVWDLGSGVGLPGIPLAMIRPQQSFVLVDRSEKRARLMRRAVRILDLDNVEVLSSEITDLESGSMQVLVSRAAFPPDEMASIASRCLSSGGVAIVGGSWVREPIIPGWETVRIPRDVLDRGIWLLIMRRQ